MQKKILIKQKNSQTQFFYSDSIGTSVSEAKLSTRNGTIMQYFHHSNDNEIAKLDESLFKKSEKESKPQLGLKCFDCVSLWSRTRNNSCITPTEKTRTKICAKNSCYSVTFSLQSSITEPEIYYARRSCSGFPENFPKPGDLVSSKASEVKILQEFSLRNTIVIQQRFRKQHGRKI